MKIPVLVYHNVAESNNLPSTITPAQFQRQICYFREKGYKFVFYDDFIKGMRDKTLTGREMVITFDDGTTDFFDNVYPIIKKYTIPVTLFLISGRLGSSIKSISHDYYYRIMSKKQILKIIGSGLVEIESHTMTHRRLTHIPINEVDDELKKSKEFLENTFKIKVRHIAYTKGNFNDQIIEKARIYYDSAAGCNIGLNNYSADIYNIKRIWMNRGWADTEYKKYLNGYYYIYRGMVGHFKNLFKDGAFRKPRIWSNSELRKFAHMFQGDIINVSAWKDIDKEGGHYRDYFRNCTSYTLSNYKKDKKGMQGYNNEIYLDLEKTLPPKLKQKYDVVFNHTTLEHVYDIKKSFSNICMLSKDIVILVVPFLQKLHGLNYDDYWRFTPASIKRLFEQNNFEMIYLSANTGPFAYGSSIYLFVIGTRKPEKWKKTGGFKRYGSYGRPDLYGMGEKRSFFGKYVDFFRNAVNKETADIGGEE